MTDLPPRLSPKILARQAELVALYRAAQDRLQKQLLGAVLTDFQKFRIGEQLQQIDAVVAALDASVAEMAAPMASAFYRHGTDLAGHALKVQGVAVGPLDLGNVIHTAGLQAVADQMALDLHTANGSIATTSKDILRKTQQKVVEERAINRILAEGLVEGQTERQTTARLTDALKAKLGDAKLVTAGSRSFTPENYAELVVRTRTREAVTAGAINRGLEYGVKLYQVSVHSTSCPECLAYQGKVYSVVPDERFPLLENRPPFHPRCRHVLLPYVEIPTQDGKAEMEALSRLSKTAGPISLSQAGFQEAVALAKRIGAEAITKQQAAALEAAAAAEALVKAAKPIRESIGNIPPVGTMDDYPSVLHALGQADDLLRAAHANQTLAAETLQDLQARYDRKAKALLDHAKAQPVTELKALAKKQGLKNWNWAKKDELVEVLATAGHAAAKQKDELTALWAEKAAAHKAKQQAAKAAKKAAELDAKVLDIKQTIGTLVDTEALAADQPMGVGFIATYKTKQQAVKQKILALPSDIDPDVLQQLNETLAVSDATFAEHLGKSGILDLKQAAKAAGVSNTPWANKTDLATLLFSQDEAAIAAAQEAVAAKKAASLAKKAAAKKAAEQAAKEAAEQAAAQSAEEIAETAYQTPGAAFRDLDAAWEGGPPYPHAWTFERDASGLGGAHPKEFWTDETGARWLFKPLHTNSSRYRGMSDISFLARSEELGYKVQRLVDPDAIEVRFVTLPDGRMGSIARMEAEPMLPGWDRALQVSTLTPMEIEGLQREQVIDWLLSNHDGHAEQYLRLQSGRIKGIDKGQAFKYFPNDRLDWTYNPTAYGSEKMAANELFYRASLGQVRLDPAHTLKTIRIFEQLPDEDYLAILRPYAESRFAGNPAALQDFLDAALRRKQNLRRDFEQLYGRALGQRGFRFDDAPARAARRLGAAEARIVEEARDARGQGKALPIDKEDIEDQSVLVWQETGPNGETRSVATLRVRPEANQKVLDAIGQPTQALGSRIGQDVFFEDFLEAVKTANHHSGDGQYNPTRLAKARQHKATLEALAGNADPDIRDMAKHYLAWLDRIEGAVAQQQKVQGGAFAAYGRQHAQQSAAAQGITVTEGTNVWKVRESTPQGIKVVKENANLREAAHGHDQIDPAQTAIRVVFDDGTEAIYKPQNRGYYTMAGHMEVTIPGELTPSTAERLMEKLERLGLDAAVATAEDRELLYLQKQAYATLAVKEPDYMQLVQRLDAAGASKADRIRELRGYWNRRLGVTDVTRLPDYKPEGVFELSHTGRGERGRRVWYRFDISEQELKDNMGSYTLVHNLTAGGMEDTIKSMLDGYGTFIPNTEKMRVGVPVGGMSPGADAHSGGLTYFYTRIRAAKNEKGIYFKQRNLLRMDALSFHGDEYGRTTGTNVLDKRKVDYAGWKGNATNSQNETDFKNGIGLLGEVDTIKCGSAAARDKILRIFRERGFDRLPDGRRIEDVVKI